MTGATTAKIVELKLTDSFLPGQEIYLSDQYYVDTHASVVEVPKYGWKVKSLIDGVATIEYQRPNWKLLMSLILETKYLKKEV